MDKSKLCSCGNKKLDSMQKIPGIFQWSYFVFCKKFKIKMYKTIILIWLWNVVSYIKGGTQGQGIRMNI